MPKPSPGVFSPKKLPQSLRPSKHREGLSAQQLSELATGRGPQICIVRSLGGIGDVLMTTPSLRALKLLSPNCHITYATDFNYMGGALVELLKNNPFIDELVTHQSVRHREFDLKVDVTSTAVGDEKPKAKVRNRIDLFAEHVGVDLRQSGFLPVYVVTEEEKKWAKEKLSRYQCSKKRTVHVGIHVRSSTKARTWPIDYTRRLIPLLQDNLNAQVYIFDSSFGSSEKEEWNFPDVITFKDYGIRQNAALINELDLLICPDSGLLHLAGALNKKIVAIFGGTDPDARINHYPNASALSARDLGCFPCWYSFKACASSFTCLQRITPEMVCNVVAKSLKLELREPIVERITGPLTTSIVVKSSSSVPTQRILVHRSAGLGDTAMMTSPLQALRKKFPQAHLAVSTHYTEVFDNATYVDEVIKTKFVAPLDKRLVEKFDKVYDLDHSVESKMVCGNKGKISEADYLCVPRMNLFYRALELGNTTIEPTHITVTDEQKEKVCPLLSTKKKNILYMANSSSHLRTYPIENASIVIEELVKDYNVIIGGDFRKAWADRKSFAVGLDELAERYGLLMLEDISTTDLISILSICDLVISGDTGPMHVAEAVQVPCVGIFSSVHPSLRCSTYKYVTPITSSLPCMADCCDRSPVALRRCPPGREELIGGHCVNSILPATVCENVQKILKGN